MDSTTMASTKSSLTPFNLLSLSYPVLRDFLKIIPLADLYVLNEQNDIIKSLSCFRGKVVTELSVRSDAFSRSNDNKSYSKFVNLPYNVTPIKTLEVTMGPDVNPEVMLSKLNEKCYTELFLTGQYNWKQVVAFLHKGVEKVNLEGSLDLPLTDLKEFYQLLLSFKIKEFRFYHDDCDSIWAEAAFLSWNLVIDLNVVDVFASDDELALIIPNDDTILKFHMNVHFD